jgi:hypothetical protein
MIPILHAELALNVRGLLVAMLVLSLVAACNATRESPESRIRSLIDQAETAAEKKNVSALRDLISVNYRDERGHDNHAIEGIIRYYLLGHQSIYLFTRIQDIVFPRPKQARAVVLVAMAGQPLRDVNVLERLKADLHRFEIRFTLEADEWKVVGAEWRRAKLDEFF